MATATGTTSGRADGGPVLRRAPRRGVRWRERLLDLVASLGALSLLGTLVLAVSGASLVVFRTGSMSPAMPVGALAVVVPTPAADVTVGDVVTVARPGSALPVTHRVVTVTADPSLGTGGALLELQGDANATADPQPYEVAQVGRVVVAAPHLGRWLEGVRSPPVLAGATLAAAALVAVAFWPGAEDRRRPSGTRRARRASRASRERRARRVRAHRAPARRPGS